MNMGNNQTTPATVEDLEKVLRHTKLSQRFPKHVHLDFGMHEKDEVYPHIYIGDGYVFM